MLHAGCYGKKIKQFLMNLNFGLMFLYIKHFRTIKMVLNGGLNTLWEDNVTGEAFLFTCTQTLLYVRFIT